MEELLAIIISIFICVVLPVSIVAIVFATIRNKDNRRSEVLLAMIEKGGDIDREKFGELFPDHKRNSLIEKALSNLRTGLLFLAVGLAVLLCRAIGAAWTGSGPVVFVGCILTALGIALVAMYFIFRKAAAREAAEKAAKAETDGCESENL